MDMVGFFNDSGRMDIIKMLDSSGIINSRAKLFLRVHHCRQHDLCMLISIHAQTTGRPL